MEGLAPSLNFALTLRLGLERGDSVRLILQTYIAENEDEMGRLVSQFLSLRDQGQLNTEFYFKIKSHYRRAILQLVDKGLRGDSILPAVRLIETEIHESCIGELELFISQLPFKVLVPLVLLIFPAFMILLIGPILSAFLTSI